MATTKLMLNKTRRLNNGTYPLVMQIIHRRKKLVLYSKLYLFDEEFDDDTGLVISCAQHHRLRKDIAVLNHIISDFSKSVNAVILRLENTEQAYTVDNIAEYLNNINAKDSLVIHWKDQITNLNKIGRIGMASAQKHTLNSVIQYYGSANISTKKLTPQFILGYERHLLERGVVPNTVCYYMRNFKSTVNNLIKLGIIDKQKGTTFDGIKTSPRKTLKRALTRETLKAMKAMQFTDKPVLELARDMFLFSFYTRGMAFVDISFLRKEDIANNLLSYTRKKTGQYLQISINKQITELTMKYTNISSYVFPIVFSNNYEVAYKEYRSALRRINKSLKIIGQQLEINIPLTTYVARHSWATLAKEQGVPVSVISEGLGHTSERITQIYLKEFDHSVLEKANNSITKL